MSDGIDVRSGIGWTYTHVVLAIKSKDFPQSLVAMLFVGGTWLPGCIEVLIVDILPEGKVGFCDIDAVVVVECTGTDMLIGQPLPNLGQLPVIEQVF